MCLWAVWLGSQFGKFLLQKLPSGGVAENFPGRICAEEAKGEMAVGPERTEAADHQQTGLVAGPVCSPCTYPSPATDLYTRDKPHCCGSIRGWGTKRGKEAVERWMEKDLKGIKYEFSGDVYHFYNSLKPDMARIRQRFKDRRVLDLIWRIVKAGVLIGAYPSPWFANTVLQPLDQLIRQSGLCAHYVRYMDNLTATGLKKLRFVVEEWLNGHGLRLKGDWQIFKTVGKVPKKPLEPPRNGYAQPKAKMPDAIWYIGQCPR